MVLDQEDEMFDIKLKHTYHIERRKFKLACEEPTPELLEDCEMTITFLDVVQH